MNHLEHLSEQELADIIAQASKALEQKRENAKRDVMAQMKALAASIGVQVEIKDSAVEPGARKGSKVAIKYRDPTNVSHAWSGRGVKPRWLQAYLAKGGISKISVCDGSTGSVSPQSFDPFTERGANGREECGSVAQIAASRRSVR